MKKTTIYLEDEELKLLKQKAFLLDTSVADLIRKVIKTIIHSSSSQEEKAMKALSEIRTQFADLNEETLIQDIVKVQREIRNEKKTKGRD